MEFNLQQEYEKDYHSGKCKICRSAVADHQADSKLPQSNADADNHHPGYHRREEPAQEFQNARCPDEHFYESADENAAPHHRSAHLTGNRCDGAG